MRPDLVVAEDGSDFIRTAALEMAVEIRRAVDLRGRCNIALAGGSTPRPVYDHLARFYLGRQIDFLKVSVYLSDERMVPPDHPASNGRMVRESLLMGGRLQPGSMHPVPWKAGDPERIAAEYAEHFPFRLDVLILGMGTDGHTASLFPGSPALEETESRITAVKGGDPDLWRVTITPRVIGEAASIRVLVAGARKAEAVRSAVEGSYDPKQRPVQLALGGRWILDRSAAGALRDGARER